MFIQLQQSNFIGLKHFFFFFVILLQNNNIEINKRNAADGN